MATASRRGVLRGLFGVAVAGPSLGKQVLENVAPTFGLKGMVGSAAKQALDESVNQASSAGVSASPTSVSKSIFRQLPWKRKNEITKHLRNTVGMEFKRKSIEQHGPSPAVVNRVMQNVMGMVQTDRVRVPNIDGLRSVSPAVKQAMVLRKVFHDSMVAEIRNELDIEAYIYELETRRTRKSFFQNLLGKVPFLEVFMETVEDDDEMCSPDTLSLDEITPN